MQKDDFINYWRTSSDNDFNTMHNLYKSKDYHWCLFLGHLVIEKLLKALYVKKTKQIVQPPKTPDLLQLAEKAGIETNNRQKDLLDLITTFNISVRYPDYKNSFYIKCTKEYTNARIKEIKELREWLIPLIENK